MKRKKKQRVWDVQDAEEEKREGGGVEGEWGGGFVGEVRQCVVRVYMYNPREIFKITIRSTIPASLRAHGAGIATLSPRGF